MGLLGEGAVAIWHDLTAEGRTEFYDWHGSEHMPERVGVPGFLRARRYVAVEADLAYFNLYEVCAPAVLVGPDYQARLNNPTPWTQTAVKSFRRVSRSLCRIAATTGGAQGGLIATWRYDVPADLATDHIAAVQKSILPDLAGNGMIAGAHLLVADQAASAIDTAERQARGEPNDIPSWILLVEGWADASAFHEIRQSTLSDAVLSAAGASGAATFGLYQLQVTITPEDLMTAKA